MQRVNYNQIGHFGDSTSRLERVASLSHKLTTWSNWKFCPVVQQLAWPFSSPYMLHTCAIQATYQLRDPVMRLFLSAHFLSFLHTLLLHNSRLNTGYLIAKLRANLAWNKTNTWLNKFNLTKRIMLASLIVCVMLLIVLNLTLHMQ